MSTPTSQMQEILDTLGNLGGLPIESLSPMNARQQPLPNVAAQIVYGQHFTKRALAPMPLPVESIQHKTLPSGNGTLRIYTPKGDAPETGWPAILYIHGGGWVIADLNTYDGSARALADGAKAVVVSLHYRQAPENPWPAPVEDSYEAWQWLTKNARSIGADSRKLAIAGESAGGNLAAVTCLIARTQGIQTPIHQLLVYPVTDVANGVNSPSAREHASAKPLNRAMLSWFYDHYVQDEDPRHPTISPMFAKSHADLPPATIILAEIDPLRTDGEMYARKLKDAGVPTKLKTYEGVTHEFFGLAGLVDEATEAMGFACEELRDAFNHATERPRRIA